MPSAATRNSCSAACRVTSTPHCAKDPYGLKAHAAHNGHFTHVYTSQRIYWHLRTLQRLCHLLRIKHSCCIALLAYFLGGENVTRRHIRHTSMALPTGMELAETLRWGKFQPPSVV